MEKVAGSHGSLYSFFLALPLALSVLTTFYIYILLIKANNTRPLNSTNLARVGAGFLKHNYTVIQFYAHICI